MKIAFTEAGWEDYLWFQQNDRKRLKRINALIKDTVRNPFEGLGKPEPLKSELSGYWSRRITSERTFSTQNARFSSIFLYCFQDRNYLKQLLPSPRFNKGIRVNL